MSEENRGRKKGQSYKKPTGYIMVKENLRIEVETDSLIISEIISKDKNGDFVWGNNKYFTSWDGVISWLIRRFTTENISKKEIWTFIDAREEIISAIKEVKSILFGEINSQIKELNKDFLRKIQNS